MVIAPARRAGDPGSNPGPGENFSLKLLIYIYIYGPKRDKNRKWRRLHNEALHSLYHSPNIVRVITSRRLRFIID